jgi:hypothetical protein
VTCSGPEGCGMVLEWLGSHKPWLWAADILLTFAGLGTGLRAAYLWFASAKIEVSPVWGHSEPGEPMASMMGVIAGQLLANNEVAKLNARAAR